MTSLVKFKTIGKFKVTREYLYNGLQMIQLLAIIAIILIYKLKTILTRSKNFYRPRNQNECLLSKSHDYPRDNKP